MAETAKQDLRDAIKTVRTFITAKMLSTPVATLQRETGADRTARGSCWVSRVTLPAPLETDALNLILDAVKGLGNGDEEYTIPTTENVRAQWTGYRAGVPGDEPEPDISEAEKFRSLQEEVRSRVTILYLHGGGTYLLGPAARRSSATKLAQLTGGKCLSLQYRLAPQNPFPAALLDSLVAYLTLLYPPAGSSNVSEPADNIIFGGDSSGAELALSIVQVILYARKKQQTAKPTLLFHGRKVELVMPVGLAFQSPSVDNQHDTLPSWAANIDYDTIPPVSPGFDDEFPADEVWPSDPPRGNFYCETSMVYHPLVCAMAAKEWQGCPPIYIAMGHKERMIDGVKYFAQLAATQGVPILWDEYELMPHNWPMGFPDHPHSEKCYCSWAEACSKFVRNAQIQSHGTFTTLWKSKVQEIEVTELSSLTQAEVRRFMASRQGSIRPFKGRPGVKFHL